MKKFVLALFALMLMASVASAQTNIIGVFADEAGTICTTNTVMYQSFTLYILALTDMVTVESITAAEFRLDGALENAGYPVGLFGVAWNTTLVILADGGMGEGVSLAFQTPLAGPVCLLGTINATPFSADYVPENYRMACDRHMVTDKLAVVNQDFETTGCLGWGAVLNCTLPDCSCESVPTESVSISSLKALY